MKFGTYTFDFDNIPLCERLDMIKKVGFDFVALDYSELDEGVKHSSAIALPVENVHLDCRGTSAIWLDGSYGDEVTDSYCNQIRACTAVGVSVGIAHVTYGSDIRPPNKDGLHRYERIVECAEKHSFTLCVENSRASEHLSYVLDNIKSRYVRYCYDSGHELGMAYGTEYFDTYLKKYGDRLAALHIHDTIQGFDMHAVPLDGALDWNRVAALLSATEYGRQKLCAEPGGKYLIKKEGMTAHQLREIYKGLSHAKFYDGYYTLYEGFTLEQLLTRILNGLKKLSDMIL